MESLQNIDKNKVLENLYETETFIPLRGYLSPDRLRSLLEACYHDANDAFSANNYIKAALILLDFFFSLFYYYICPVQLIDNIANALMRASKKYWSETADTLWDMLVRMINAR